MVTESSLKSSAREQSRSRTRSRSRSQRRSNETAEENYKRLFLQGENIVYNNETTDQPTKKMKNKGNNSALNPSKNGQDSKKNPNPKASNEQGSSQQGNKSLPLTNINPIYNNRYVKTDRGPFKAVLSLKNTLDTTKSTPAPRPPLTIEVTRDLVKMGISFESITTLGRFKWIVTFNNKSNANNAVENPYLSKSKYEMYIPQRMFSRVVIIKGIPKDISSDELKDELHCSNPGIRPMECTRLMRRITTNGTTEYVESTTYKIRIRTLTIPEAVYLWKARTEVAPYIPPTRQCFNCGKLNHTSKFCRQISLCLDCGQDKHENEPCKMPLLCVNCKGTHKALEPTCPEKIKYKEIAKIIATENVDFRTAMRKVNSSSNHESHNIPSLLSHTAFPPLPTNMSPTLRQSSPCFSQVASQSPTRSQFHPVSQSQQSPLSQEPASCLSGNHEGHNWPHLLGLDKDEITSLISLIINFLDNARNRKNQSTPISILNSSSLHGPSLSLSPINNGQDSSVELPQCVQQTQ